MTATRGLNVALTTVLAAVGGLALYGTYVAGSVNPVVPAQAQGPDWAALTSQLTSSDPAVRLTGAKSVYFYVLQGEDPTTHAPLRAALLDAADDPSVPVRSPAMYSLFGYPPASDIEDLMVVRYEQEGDSKARLAAIQVLQAHGYTSPETEQVMISALSDGSDDIRAAGAFYAQTNTPPAALSALAAGLANDADDAFIVENFVRAIGAYGSSASAYLGQLQELQASVDDDFLRQEIENAIANIQGP